QAAFAQRNHAFFASHALDFRSGAAIDNHLADAIGQVEEFANSGAAVETSAGAFETAGAFHESHAGPGCDVQTCFFQLLIGIALGFFAVGANDADQALGHDAIQGGNEIVRLDAHVDEAADDVGDVVGVNSGENEVSGKGGLDGDLRGFLVADFADH